jgi:hypothetical protein
LATADDEVYLSIGYLKRTIGVAPFRWWWWRALLAVVVIAVVVVLVTSIITPIIAAVIALVITAIILLIVTPVVAVIFVMIILMVVVAAVVAVIITSIPVVVPTIGSAVAVTTSIRSTITIVVTEVAILVFVVVALGLLGFRGYPEGTLELFAVCHGMSGVTVELTLIVHDPVEVTLEEGGRSWWICHMGFTRSLARPVSAIVVILSIEVVHYRVLSVD